MFFETGLISFCCLRVESMRWPTQHLDWFESRRGASSRKPLDFWIDLTGARHILFCVLYICFFCFFLSFALRSVYVVPCLLLYFAILKHQLQVHIRQLHQGVPYYFGSKKQFIPEFVRRPRPCYSFLWWHIQLLLRIHLNKMHPLKADYVYFQLNQNS